MARNDRIRLLIAQISEYLPSQGPIKDFIHHNTLHAFQDLPFADALIIASQMYGSRAYFRLSQYREYFDANRISPVALKEAILRNSSEDQSDEIFNRMVNDSSDFPDEVIPLGISENGYRKRWKSEFEININSLVNPSFFRLIAAYLDQGISFWKMPSTKGGFFESVYRIAKETWIPWVPYSDPIALELFECGPEKAIQKVLDRFVGSSQHYERYLAETLLAHPGWSGMVHEIEKHPSSLVSNRNISLLEFTAVKLIAEFTWVSRRLGPNFRPIVNSNEPVLSIPAKQKGKPILSDTQVLQKIWHDAYEQSYWSEVAFKIENHIVSDVSKNRPDFQAYFCIDDRACSLRRHLEEVGHVSNLEIETFSTAGFFGVDCVFQGAQDAFPFKHCPVPLLPKYLIREFPNSDLSIMKKSLHLESHSNSFIRGWLISQIFGFWSALKLAASVFRPSFSLPTSPMLASSLTRINLDSDLKVIQKTDLDARTEIANPTYFQSGYSVQEMADRVGQVLKTTGAFKRGISDLVFIIGHGASTNNNPYFAAYDCGACSGKPGGPNARAFAIMANHPEVRLLLAQRGLSIPDTSWFLGGMHDTTRDEVQYYDVNRIPRHLVDKFAKFQEVMERSLGRNAKERCLRFERVSKTVTEKEALKEVRKRSTAIFETRPEMNHASNAVCIVGRRALTKGLSLNRRAFLNSYDPEIDPDGDALLSILNAVIPVCGGINLEYFFSRVDPEKYGAGSKLPQNVCGLIGVIHGNDGDLLTGLPTQMTEIHEPVRLMLIIEQDLKIIKKTLNRNPEILNWVEKSWIKLFAIRPGTKEVNPILNTEDQ